MEKDGHASLPVRIRRLTHYREFEKLLDIQRQVWNHDEEDLTPVHQFCISSYLGAIVLGAYVGEKLAGFVYSFPAVFNGKLIQHSHLLAVLPDYRRLGLGKKLKWAQRREALRMGYDFITWTVDPLQARNANLNLHTLGAMTRTYLRDFYGRESALILGPGIPTDRFLMEWPIRSEGVELRRKKKFPSCDLAAVPRALEQKAEDEKSKTSRRDLDPNHTGTKGRVPRHAKRFFPGTPKLGLTDRLILAELPPDINPWKGTREPVASWQEALRRVFEHYFRRGYAATDFLFGDRCFYVLTSKAGRRP